MAPAQSKKPKVTNVGELRDAGKYSITKLQGQKDEKSQGRKAKLEDLLAKQDKELEDWMKTKPKELEELFDEMEWEPSSTEGPSRNSPDPEVPLPTTEKDQQNQNAQNPQKGNQQNEGNHPPPSSLFASDSEDDDDDDQPPVDDEYGPALMYVNRPAKGEDFETVQWCNHKSAKYFFNRYGPKNASIFRLEKEADSPNYDTTTRRNNASANQFGSTPESKAKHPASSIFGVFGIAFVECDLEMLNPIGYEKGKNMPLVWLWIFWWVMGGNGKPEIDRRWETRTTLRDRWGRDFADQYIYGAAKEAQDKFRRYKQGKIGARGDTPESGLLQSEVNKKNGKKIDASEARRTHRAASEEINRTKLQKFREKSVPRDVEYDETRQRSRSSTPRMEYDESLLRRRSSTPRTQFIPSAPAQNKDIKKQTARFCAMHGVNTVDELSVRAQASLLQCLDTYFEQIGA